MKSPRCFTSTFLSATLIVVILGACNSNNSTTAGGAENELTPAKFQMADLVGSWVRTSDSKISHEIWEVNGDRGWKANSQTADSTGAIVFYEEVLLEKRNGVWQYCVTSPNENDKREVCFTLVSSDQKHMRFENKAHDFPQAISYEWVDTNNVLAYIEGPDGNGGTMRVDFDFKREDKK